MADTPSTDECADLLTRYRHLTIELKLLALEIAMRRDGHCSERNIADTLEWSRDYLRQGAF